MKFTILHSNNTQNYGTFMMTINTILYLYEKYPQSEFFVELGNENDLERLRIELDNPSIPIHFLSAVPLGNYKNSIQKNMFRLKKYSEQTKYIVQIQPDAVIYLGGDDFSEYYNKYKVLVELYYAHKLSKKFPTFFLGQTIGPFSKWRIPLVRKFLSRSYIITRDENSYKYLRKTLQHTQNTTSHDLAFFDLPLQNNQDILSQYALESNQYITLVPSGLAQHYTSNYDDYLNVWYKIVQKLLQNPQLNNKKILLLAHVIKETKVDDRNIINDLKQKIQNDDTIDTARIISITNILLASQARAILGHGALTISGRVHATVSTFQMGKPAIPLSYSVKYAGVIGQSLQRDDLIIEAKNDKLWKSGEIVTQVNQKIDYVIDNYSSLRTSITNRVTTIQSELSHSINEELNSKLV